MFKKKKCKRCGEKFKSSYDFCPHCGNSQNKDEFFNENEWGMFGKNDLIESNPFRTEIRLPFGLKTLFNSLVKNLDSQLKQIDKELGKEIKNKENANQKNFKKSGGISISISSFGNQPPKIKVNSFGNMPEFKEKEESIKQEIKKQKTELSEENLKKLSKLPREEPSTNIRRLSNKVVYEINLPGVKSLKDISIIELENSIEIKAISKDKAYFKLIPLNLPIQKQKFSNGKLILELESS